MISLVFPGSAYQDLRATLLSASPLEAGALLLAGSDSGKGRTRLLARQIVHVPSGGYLKQEAGRLVITPAFLAPHLKRARIEGWSLVLAHSHPFGGQVSFSRVDDDGETILLPSIVARAPSRVHGSLVVGYDGFDSRFWLDQKRSAPIDSIVEVGRLVRWYRRRPSAVASERGSQRDDLFDRNVRAFGIEGQRILEALCVGIVGLGGMGSIVAQELAYLGVRRMILLDPETLEQSNLNRVVGSTGPDVGKPKVDVTEHMVRGVRADAQVKSIRGSALIRSEASSILDADFIFCCTDSHGSRAVLNQLAYQYLIPTIDTGIRIDSKDGRVTSVNGRIQLLAPGLACLACQRLLDPEEVRRDLLSDNERQRDPYIVGSAVPQPSVVSLNGTTASLAVTMFLAAVTGLPLPARHQLYLADRGVVRSVESAPLTDCVVCSINGALGRGDLWPLPWRLQ